MHICGTADAEQVNVRGGYFLQEDLALFDTAFFAISSSEAAVSYTEFVSVLRF